VRTLAALVCDAAALHPDRPAFETESEAVTYREMLERAGRIAAALGPGSENVPTLGAVFATRGAAAYVGIVGTLLSGAGYVPLNPRFPDERCATMLAQSTATSLVLEAALASRLPELLRLVTVPLVIVVPDLLDASELRAAHPSHRFVTGPELMGLEPRVDPPRIEPDAVAYVMFTSGSTGQPKGVAVTHANVFHHLSVMWARYGVGPDDRFSQTFDLTFDLSVFDLFMAWGRGASVHTLGPKQLLAPAKRVASQKLTVWFSVPSVGMLMRGLGQLKPASLPSLRLSLFCGERLPADVAEAWAIAAPNSIVENLYGPTEVTIACTHYRWDRALSAAACVDGVVPIGKAYPGMRHALVDERLALVPDGERGELCIWGPQVTPGYFRDAEKTREKFVVMPWDRRPDARWYRTGDLAFVNTDGDLIHCGRNDDQVKIRGYRIELAEVEHALRKISGTDFVAVVPAGAGTHGATKLVAFIAGGAVGDAELLAAARQKLPDYMLPAEIVRLEGLPLNTNGKVDKKALRALLEPSS